VGHGVLFPAFAVTLLSQPIRDRRTPKGDRFRLYHYLIIYEHCRREGSCL